MPKLPAELRGRGGPDALMAAVGRFSDLMTPLLGLTARGRRPAGPVDRSLQVVVTSVRAEADGVVSVRLADLAGRPLPGWQPGCHLDVHLPSGRVRQYSLCGDPRDRTAYRIAVRLIEDGGGGSREVHALAEGRRLTVSPPRNAFPLAVTARHVFVAGGIGITPILPMVQAAARRGADWHLLYLGRTAAALPFLDELAPHGDRVTVRTDDLGGPPSAALLPDVTGATVHACGPAPLIGLVRDAVRGRALSFHSERFTPAPVVGGRPFEVRLARQNVTVHVPAGRTALDAIRDAVPDVAYSCRQGFCGTCRVRVLGGEPDHRDNALTDDERRSEMMICVSRATGLDLTLDL
ncbi:PDR/VanB family oxidoreductase [Actinocorallia longicatena]|uniref:PDR/VanB family oxidoreductase n=1 Tax=Actinocorallia longicatena TaxID=111803 RepID=A0ABP6PUU9_9ACTN